MSDAIANANYWGRKSAVNVPVHADGSLIPSGLSVQSNFEDNHPEGQYYRDFASFARKGHGSILLSAGLNDSERSQVKANDAAAAYLFAHFWRPYTAILAACVRSIGRNIESLPVQLREQWACNHAKGGRS